MIYTGRSNSPVMLQKVCGADNGKTTYFGCDGSDGGPLHIPRRRKRSATLERTRLNRSVRVLLAHVVVRPFPQAHTCTNKLIRDVSKSDDQRQQPVHTPRRGSYLHSMGSGAQLVTFYPSTTVDVAVKRTTHICDLHWHSSCATRAFVDHRRW